MINHCSNSSLSVTMQHNSINTTQQQQQQSSQRQSTTEQQQQQFEYQ
ncbi:hypothetical protein DOY81_012093 [Sarcophaga bullata]|nr:hypothetical protein DOY81_012093 [Sarcophaga bullata]